MAPPSFEAKLFWKVQFITSMVEPASTYIAPPLVALPFENTIFFKITCALFAILKMDALFEASRVYPLPSIVTSLVMSIPSVPTLTLSVSEKV